MLVLSVPRAGGRGEDRRREGFCKHCHPLALSRLFLRVLISKRSRARCCCISQLALELCCDGFFCRARAQPGWGEARAAQRVLRSHRGVRGVSSPAVGKGWHGWAWGREASGSPNCGFPVPEGANKKGGKGLF